MKTGTMYTGTMYTGTMISELMAAVERAEQTASRQQMALQEELHAIFTMQIPITDGDRLLLGAA